MNYIVAFSHEEVIDVTRRYTSNWEELSRRRTLVSENFVQSFLSNLNKRLEVTILPQERKNFVLQRRAKEFLELSQDNNQIDSQTMVFLFSFD